ncbi:MAG TPA: FUSC family protein [Acidisarcina sp.]|nr:FUSC family protein [Acidisarcina sp.]
MTSLTAGEILRTSQSWFDRLLTSGRRTLLVQGAKTGLAAGLCYWLSLRFGLHEGYWSAISAIIVLQSNVGSTVTASRDRFIGTAIGAVLGFLASPWQRHPAAYAVTILIALLACGLLNLKNSSRLAAVTITIVMLVERNGSHWTIALNRVIEVIIGIFVALAVSVFVLPRRARQHLQTGLKREFEAQAILFEATLRGFGGTLPEDLQLKRETVSSLRLSNEQLLRAARNEPASGPASIEGLSLLSEFGRSIFDALLALEVAVRESCHDQYGARLEPELHHLILGINQSFKLLAECVGLWRFDLRRTGLDLERDVLALQAKVLEIRHTSITFPLDEVLRAYAVQLNLKHIAQLLRAARHDAQDATGGQDR